MKHPWMDKTAKLENTMKAVNKVRDAKRLKAEREKALKEMKDKTKLTK